MADQLVNVCPSSKGMPEASTPQSTWSWYLEVANTRTATAGASPTGNDLCALLRLRIACLHALRAKMKGALCQALTWTLLVVTTLKWRLTAFPNRASIFVCLHGCSYRRKVSKKATFGLYCSCLPTLHLSKAGGPRYVTNGISTPSDAWCESI